MSNARSRRAGGTRAAALALAVALPLSACGEKPADPPAAETPTQKTTTQKTTTQRAPTQKAPTQKAPTRKTTPQVKRMVRPEGGKLAWRGQPLDVGSQAPEVEGLANRDAVIVFFRGTW